MNAPLSDSPSRGLALLFQLGAAAIEQVPVPFHRIANAEATAPPTR
jgi:hypothetical protein